MNDSLHGGDLPIGNRLAPQADRATLPPSPLVEVWGDTVDIRHLGWSVVLGIAISLGAFALANRVLAAHAHDAAMSRAYAMLVGLAGCLVAGAVCAKLFKPKREVVEESSDLASREAVLDQLAAEAGGLGSVKDLPEEVAAEMKELGLYDVFAAHERRVNRAQNTAPAAETTAVLAGSKEVF